MSERQNFYFDIANQLSVAGAYDEAENYYLKADRLSPGHPFISNNRGGNFTRWGKLEDAEKSFRQALRREPLHKKARKNLGDVLLKLGRNDEALSQYEKALEIDNSYHDAWYGRGNVLLHLENYPEAEECFCNANRLSPKDTRYLINLGASLAMQQKYRDALTAYQKAYQLDKDNLALKECITYLRSKK
jgi:tetratricopeptide (TPR) repeat protein